MKPEIMLKVSGLCRRSVFRTYNGQKIKRGPYWYGWYFEKGQQMYVYIGKELPKHLEWLLKERVKLPGRKRWTWPNSKNWKKREKLMRPT